MIDAEKLDKFYHPQILDYRRIKAVSLAPVSDWRFAECPDLKMSFTIYAPYDIDGMTCHFKNKIAITYKGIDYIQYGYRITLDELDQIIDYGRCHNKDTYFFENTRTHYQSALICRENNNPDDKFWMPELNASTLKGRAQDKKNRAIEKSLTPSKNILIRRRTPSGSR